MPARSTTRRSTLLHASIPSLVVFLASVAVRAGPTNSAEPQLQPLRGVWQNELVDAEDTLLSTLR